MHLDASVGRSTALRRLARVAIAVATMLVLGPLAAASDRDDDDLKSLDERVQHIKSDVLEIAAELTQLEEKLLYPSNTQFSVFVSLATGDSTDLDSVEVTIDGAPIARHIYTFKELEALRKGGVQRLYTGNMKVGDHQVLVTVRGKRPSGAEFVEEQTFSISKQVKPKLVDLRFASTAAGGLDIELGEG